MDVFSWSMPFLAEKIMQMLVTIVSKFDDADEGGDLNLNEKDLTGMSQE
jgi:hypothetical protein